MIQLYQQELREALGCMPAESFDAVIFDATHDMAQQWLKEGGRGDGIRQWCDTWLSDVLRVLKPGAHVVGIGFPLAHHRLVAALEDTENIEIRDSLQWIHAFGHQQIVLGRKTFRGGVAHTIATWGTGALHVNACRVAGPLPASFKGKGWASMSTKNAEHGFRPSDYYADQDGFDYQPHADGRWPTNVVFGHHPDCRHEENARWRCAHGCPVRSLNLQQGSRPSKHPPSVFFSQFGWAAGEYADKLAWCRQHGGHPRPVALLRWLIRLIVPPGGRLLVPFAGDGVELAAGAAEARAVVGFCSPMKFSVLAQELNLRNVSPHHSQNAIAVGSE